MAPRPFQAEVLGSGIGRMASRYRMSMQEFAAAHQLDLCIPNAGGRLMMQALPNQSVDCLVALTRISRRKIEGIAVPGPQADGEPLFRYCPRCVFLNPLDVAAPIWRREWLDPAVPACPVHAIALNALRPPAAMACQTLDQPLRLVSRRELQLRAWPSGRRASVVR